MLGTVEDLYAVVREISQGLRKGGADELADRIDTALITGSTGSEVVGILKLVLQEIENAAPLQEEPMRSKVGEALAFTRLVWPDQK